MLFLESPQEIICSAELDCVCMWALALSNKILFSESKPLPAQKGPSGAAGAGQGVTQSPWADPHGPNPALVATQVSWGMPCCSNTPWWEQWASSLFADLFLQPHHSQAGFPHLFLFKKSLKSTGLKVPACLKSHKSCCFLMLCKSANKY